MRELDFTDIMNEVAEQGIKAESSQGRTVPTGRYRLRYQGHKAQIGDTGGPFLSFNVAFENDGHRKGSGFLEVMWKKERNNNGKLTRRAQLYGQLLTALDLPEETPVHKVADAFQGSLIGAYVTETLRSPEGAYVEVGAERRETDGKLRVVNREEANNLVATGWVMRNYVQNVFKPKV